MQINPHSVQRYTTKHPTFLTLESIDWLPRNHERIIGDKWHTTTTKKTANSAVKFTCVPNDGHVGHQQISLDFEWT